MTDVQGWAEHNRDVLYGHLALLFLLDDVVEMND